MALQHDHALRAQDSKTGAIRDSVRVSLTSYEENDKAMGDGVIYGTEAKDVHPGDHEESRRQHAYEDIWRPPVCCPFYLPCVCLPPHFLHTSLMLSSASAVGECQSRLRDSPAEAPLFS